MHLRFIFAFLLILAFTGFCIALPTTAIPTEPVTTVSPETSQKARKEAPIKEEKVTKPETVEIDEDVDEGEYFEDEEFDEGMDEGCGCPYPVYQMAPDVPSVAEVLVQTLPNIPMDLSYTLVHMQPGLVNFIIKNHPNLNHLLLNTDTHTLEYVVRSTPKFAKYLSRLPPETIYQTLFRMPYPCQFMLSIDKLYANVITLKVPMMSTCFPPTTTTTSTTTTTTTTTTTAAPTTTPEPNIIPEDHFTKEELDFLTTKIPNIRQLLVMVSPVKLQELREIVPDLTIVFKEFNSDFINSMNDLDLSKYGRRAVRDIIGGMVDKNVEIELFASLFE